MSQLLPINTRDAEHVIALTVVTNPVAGDVKHYYFPLGETLDVMIASVPELADAFHRNGVVTLHRQQDNGTENVSEVPRKAWSREAWAQGESKARIWLKDGKTRITLWAPAFGGGAKGKNILATVATLALVAVATVITGGAAAPFLGAGFAAGTLGAQGLALAVTFFGRLAISMVAKPAAAPKDTTANQPVLGQAGASGNTLDPGGSGWRVAGPLKVFPPMASFPLTELVGDDEIVEATYQLVDVHQLRNIKIENTPIGLVPDVQYHENEGTDGSTPSLVQRYGKQVQPSVELVAHRRDQTTAYLTADQLNPDACLPRPHTWTTAKDPDRIWLQFLWPTGLTDGATNAVVKMPLRLSMRISGTETVINLPELMFHSDLSVKFSKMVELTWDEPPSPIVDQAFNNGAWNAFHTVPVQTATPAGIGGWTADPSFVGGAGINQCARVERRKDRFVIYLDPAVFPRGNYWQITMLRGSVVGGVNTSTYFTSGDVKSYFHYYDTGTQYRLPYTYTKTILDSCILLRAASVWDETPHPVAGDAIIQVKGRNINITQLSVEAAGLVKTWDGTGFSGLAPSNNPADWLYHVRTSDRLTAEPIPERLIDLPKMGLWHAANIAAGRTIAGVFDGRDQSETESAICSAGLAKPTRGRLYGVALQRDSSAEMPRQVFSPKNSTGFRMDKPFARVPDAIRVSFRNKNDDWADDRRLVVRPGLTLGDVQQTLAMDAVFIDNPDQIESYFKLYLAAAWHRDHSFQFTTFFSGLAAEEGDVIGINHLMLQRLHASARIVAVTRNGLDEITHLTLDRWLGEEGSDDLEDVLDLSSLDDVSLAGVDIGAAIADAAGLVTTHVIASVDSPARRIAFAVPFVNDDVLPGNLVVAGEQGSEYLRCEITSIVSKDWKNFTITCVPEAPEQWVGI